MSSISQFGGEGQDLPHSKALSIRIKDAERDRAEQCRQLKRLRRERRLAKRREASVCGRTHARRGLFWSGNTAFAAAAGCFISDQIAVGFELVEFALAVWLAAVQLPPQA
ncbi:hypothetical protein ACH4NF_35465 [Streptomyces sp. NPDC017248]|uniref:hypothetical protein n=1 Tax=unclassified Streptomyces TaxID=2593676 RepID=UPI0037B68224